jgi:integrase
MKRAGARPHRKIGSDEHYLHVTGKGQRDRLVPITPALFRRLNNYTSKYRAKDADTDRIFLAQRRSRSGDYDPLTGSGVNKRLLAPDRAGRPRGHGQAAAGRVRSTRGDKGVANETAAQAAARSPLSVSIQLSPECH